VSGRVARVLMTADAVGGVWTYALDLSRALAALDIEVVVATMGRPPTHEQRAQAAAIPSLQLVESSYKLEWMDDPWDDVARAGGWLLDLERRYAPNVVHLNGYAHGGLPFRAPVLMVGHSCVLSWWQAVKAERAPLRYGAYRSRVRTGLSSADLVVAPTCSMLAALQHHYGPLPRSVVVSNACDLSEFAPRAKRPLVAAAGRIWDEAKNLQTLARAARDVSWAVCIAGESARPDGTGGEHAQLADVVALPGQLSRSALAELLGHASIYAFPARYEPFGLSVLEAASAGAALVLGDIPSLRELWQGAAEFVAPDDHELLARTIEALSLDTSRREALARRARLRARGHTLELFGRRYRELYEQLNAKSRTSWRAYGQLSSGLSMVSKLCSQSTRAS
jgi:glycogen synthase